jgi:hypothetical protein
MAKYQKNPLTEPLLKSLPRPFEKRALDCFRSILLYTSPTGDVAPAQRIVEALYAAPELRDEVYLQLIKQTRANPNKPCLLRTWHLLLIVATVFPSTRNSETVIKTHLTEESKNPDPHIASLAQFTYIRFNARCLVGKPLIGVGISLIQRIPTDDVTPRVRFGGSLYEQMWHQKNQYPLFPVPMIVHQMATAILDRGAENIEGIFRLSGNGRVIAEMKEKINQGELPLGEGTINDIATVFKQWFGSLDDPIVHRDFLPRFRTAFETKDYMAFVAELPQVHQLTLKYLIGFLQRMKRAEAQTKMTENNLAIVFGPNLIDLEGIKEPLEISEASQMAQDFIGFLIRTWDTSDIYPPAPELLQPSVTP